MEIKDVAYFVTDKVPCSCLSNTNYIGVDNIKPNKQGIIPSTYKPIDGSATKFEEDDILIGNIRPYLKKIWLASFSGGASPDVLVLRCKNKKQAKIVYCQLMSDSFFNYVMQGAKGSKMPRGDKNHILEYTIYDIFNSEKVSKLILNITLLIKTNQKINDNLAA